MNKIDELLNSHFAGKVVRKDLTKLVKGNAVVPTYVLEYLLGQYCASDDEETINQGVETVKNIVTKHFVHREEAQIIKSTVKEQGSLRIIDKISVKLNDREDIYEARFANLGIKNIPINGEIIKMHQKLLSEGVWCILVLAYEVDEERIGPPWQIENLKPIQISGIDLLEYKVASKKFSKEEWIDALMQTIGLNPAEFTYRSKLIQLTRLVPFVENNYNLVELGPKGTGKSHIFSELSPHGILVSGGEVTKAKLFVNNTTGDPGLVGYWDVVTHDEFAGKKKKSDRGLIDIMKNYMANKTFSRGTQVYGATASMVFVGNTDHTVSYMLKHSDLFDALPKDYYDSAFLDRIHAYLPGWEVQKLRNEMFSSDFGFIVDYLAEILKSLRKEDRTNDYSQYFTLSKSISTRDKTAIEKTYAGLSKIIYPHGEISETASKELLDFAIENRKRVQLQLQAMDDTFEAVDFSYTCLSSGKTYTIETLEMLEHGTAAVEKEKSLLSPVADNVILKECVLQIKDNQNGISYKSLLGAYLKGVQQISVVDAHIQLPHQLRNFMEFAKLISELKNNESEVNLHLMGAHNLAVEAVEQITLSLEAVGIIFTYEFDPFMTGNYITLDNGWKIKSEHGLDLWQHTGGIYDLNEYLQEARLCKEGQVMFNC